LTVPKPAGSTSSRSQVRRGEVVAVLGGSILLASTWVVVAVSHGVPAWE
jgi:hypothetical protein